MALREFKVRDFDKGLVTSVEDFSIEENAASSSLNWLTMGDKIELSGGYRIVGTEQSGTGKVTGLFVGEKVDGTKLPLRSRGKKVEYYSGSDWTEISTDLLGTDADGEDVSFTQYVSLAGYQVWASSPNSGLYKIMMANPGSAENQYDAAENFKGLIKSQGGRLYLWNRANNRNYIYGSYKDVQNSVVYTAVASDALVGTCTMTIASPCVVTKTSHGLTTNDVIRFTTTGALATGVTAGTAYYVISTGLTANAFQFSASLGGSAVNTSGSQSGTHSLYSMGEFVGASGSTVYSGTLADVTGLRTCLAVSITDGTQTVSDDRNGAFTGDGTGTINYTTGAYSVTFDSATTAAVSAGYSWEDSTEEGLADFTYSATRTATQGFFLPQPTGGDIRDILFYKNAGYSIHDNAVWLVTIDDDDLAVSNVIHRVNVGMSSVRAAVEAGEGIYFVDDSNPSKPTFSLLSLDSTNAEVVPSVFSYSLDLSGYDFSEAAAVKWGDFVLFFGKVTGAAANNRLFAYNRLWKSLDILEYYGSCAADNDGELWVGDSATNNVYKAFAGHTANGSLVRNYWEGKLSQVGLDEIKKFKRLTLKGQIGAAQSIQVSISYDGGAFSSLGSVEGTGDYVSASSTSVGSTMVGSAEIGGGSSGTEAYDYVREFRVRSGRFDRAKLRFEATGVGYASVSELEYYDVTGYGQKNLKSFRTT